MSTPLLQVRDLRVGFQADDALLTAVDGISFDIAAGQTLGIVGESGCGKTVTAMSLMRLLPQPAGRILGGSITFDGKDLVNLPLEHMRKVRGKDIAMIFQEPMTALNPVHRVGKQIIENLLIHQQLTPTVALRRAVELMEWVGIPAPDQRVNEFPHQLSGGMRQRVMIAMALSCNPKLLIADEPTTALDVTVQAQILDLIKRLQRDTGMAVILITHDLAVVAETCDEVAVMYAGRIAERGPVRAIFDQPLHPYTQGLIRCLPKLEHPPKTPLPIIEGMVPSLRAMPSGCRFAPRSGHAHSAAQLSTRPTFEEASPGHWVESCAACMGIEIAKTQLNEYDLPHDHQPSRIAESALESAIHHLRTGEGASGETSGRESRESQRKKQFQSLAAWAKILGKLIAADRYQTPFALGAEHRVFYNDERHCAIKITNTGRCGVAYPNGEPDSALPLEYLERWLLQNQIFGDSAEWEGVIDSPAGFSLVMSQPWITGDVPTEESIAHFMQAAGFAPTEVPESFYRPSDDLAVMDCHDGNFVATSGGVILPIDVIIVHPDSGLRSRLGLPS